MATVQQILDAINQKGAVASCQPPLVITPTRFVSLNNEVLRLGGVAGGRIYELYAPTTAGKSTLALAICADYQSQGKLAAYLDVEGTTQTRTIYENGTSWMENIGVDENSLIFPTFGSAEDLFEIVKHLIMLGVNIICIDTVAVLQPSDVIFRDEERMNMNERGLLAKALTAFFNGLVGGFGVRVKKAKTTSFLEVPRFAQERMRECGITIRDLKTHRLAYYDSAIIGVNHSKNMIGVMYGDPTYTPGGVALGMQSSVRIGATKPTKSKEKIRLGNSEVPMFRKSTWTAAKNKLASPFGQMAINIYYDGRIEEDVTYTEIALQKGLISIIGRTVTLEVGEDSGKKMSKADFELYASENPEFLDALNLEVSDEAIEEPRKIDIKSLFKTKSDLGVSNSSEEPSRLPKISGLSFRKDV